MLYKKSDIFIIFWMCVNVLYDEMDGGWDKYNVNLVDIVLCCLIVIVLDYIKILFCLYIDNVIKLYVMFKVNFMDDERVDIMKNILYG